MSSPVKGSLLLASWVVAAASVPEEDDSAPSGGGVLFDVCPNCGGGFVPRPIRPRTERRPGVCLGKHPASTKRVHLKWERAELAEFLFSRDPSVASVH